MEKWKKKTQKVFAVVLAVCVLFASFSGMGTIAKAEAISKEYDFGSVEGLSYFAGVKGDLSVNGWYLKDVGFEAQKVWPNVSDSGDYLKLYANTDVPDRWVDIGIDVPEAGTYEVAIQMGTIVNSEFGSGKLTLGGKSVNITSVPDDPDQVGTVMKETELGQFELEAGENVLRIELTDKLALFVKKLIITKTDASSGEQEIHEVYYRFNQGTQFHTFEEGNAIDIETNGWKVSNLVKTADYNNAANNQTYGMKFAGGPGASLEISFLVPAEGDYRVNFLYLAYQAYGSQIEAELEGNKVLFSCHDSTLAQGTFSNEKAATFGTIHLTEGKHTIKLTSKSSEASFLVGIELRDPALLFPEIDLSVPIVYDFKQPLSGDITQQLWGNVKTALGSSIRTQPYGIQVSNDSALDETVTLELYIPEDGIYFPIFTGYQSDGGGTYDLFLQNNYMGEFSFYNSESTKPMNLVRLTKGVQELQLKYKERIPNSWGGCAYLTELKLEYVNPDAETALQTGDSDRIYYPGQKDQLSFLVEAAGGTLLPIQADSYVSSNPDVVTVDSSGNLSAVAEGNATITASIIVGETTWQETIDVSVDGRVLDQVSVTLEKNPLPISTTTTAIVSGTLTGGEAVNIKDCSVAFSSGNENIFTVDSATGEITPKAIGSAEVIVSVTLANTTKTGNVLVEVVPVSFDRIELKLGRQYLFIGQQTGLEITGYNNDNSKCELDPSSIQYQFDPEGSAQVSNGILTALSEAETATVTVTAEAGGISREASITYSISDPETVEPSKKQTTIYTAEDRANALKNIEENTWAQTIRDGAVNVADDIFRQHPDDAYDFLWEAVTTQYLPRAAVVSLNQSELQNVCPSCGEYLNGTFGSYPWIIDVENNPWKIKCPNCSTLFPTNDFEAYYKGGIDENGNFDPDLAKAHNDELIAADEEGNLVNKSGQHTDDPSWGVDNGYGFQDSSGVFHNFIAYYNHWGLWSDNSGNALIEKAIINLTDAYLYTGDAKYANLGIVLLDRIADIYPDMDLRTMEPENTENEKYQNSHGGTFKGKIIGCIWETSNVQNYIRAYDAFYPVLMDSAQNGEAISFLTEKAQQYKMANPKSSGALICKNIEDNILRVVYPEIKDAKIRGNFGMHQAALALAAVCLDSNPETKEWLDFTFQAGDLVKNNGEYSVSGGDIMATLINKVNRDGFGNEVAPGYNLLWIDQLKQVADVLDGYTGYEGADLYQNPKFMKMFSAHYPLILAQKYLAQIGDSGATGNTGISMPLQSLVEGYSKFEDPILAQLVYYLNGNSSKGLHVGIFESDPNGISDKIEAVIQEQGTLDLDSENLAAYGFAVLRGGKSPQTAGGTSIDFKNMTWTTTPGISADVHSSGVVQYHATINDPGAWIEFEFELEEGNDYTIFFTPFSAASYGIYDILIDGQMILEGYNFYTGGKTAFNLAEMNLAAGKHTIRFENARPHMDPDNPDAVLSTNLKLGVTRLTFYTPEDMEVIQAGTDVDSQYDVWLHYGSTDGHGHRDALNLGIHAFGLDAAPDNGYVTNATDNARRYEWEANTISHNTVVVDSSKQKAIGSAESATPLHFDGGKKVQIVDVDASEVYAQTSMYRRTLIQVAVDEQNAYTLDLFRVKGGDEHVYSFHGAEGTVTTEGLSLQAQEAGTYAGAGIAFGPVTEDGTSASSYMGGGYQWLKNVQKDENPESGFSVEWDLSDSRKVLDPPQDIRLRLTMLNDLTDVALAEGEPPQLPGNPSELTYLLARTKGEDLNTTFTAVIEPYNETRYISKIEEVPVLPADEDVKAVKVTLANGRVDYIVNALDSQKDYLVDNLFHFSGFVGVYSMNESGVLDYLYLNDGSQIAGQEVLGSVSGTVTDFTKDLNAQNTITLEMDETYPSYQFLVGRDIYIENGNAMNGVYRIEGIAAAEGNRVTIDIGNTTLIQSFVDAADLESGYHYNIAEGDPFRIPLSEEITKFGGTEEPEPDQPANEENEEPDSNPLFDDIEGHWAEDAIEQLAKAGIVAGVGNHKFLPNATASRAEFVAMLARALKLTSNADVPFSDVDADAWYAKELAAAVEASLVAGYEDGTFRGTQQITRQEAMAFLSRALSYLEVAWEGDSSVLDSFADRDSVPVWAETDIAKLVSLDIVHGADGNRLNPLEKITRAEIAVMVAQIMERYVK